MSTAGSLFYIFWNCHLQFSSALYQTNSWSLQKSLQLILVWNDTSIFCRNGQHLNWHLRPSYKKQNIFWPARFLVKLVTWIGNRSTFLNAKSKAYKSSFPIISNLLNFRKAFWNDQIDFIDCATALLCWFDFRKWWWEFRDIQSSISCCPFFDDGVMELWIKL